MVGFTHFFIDRPIFAAVISVLLTLVGAISLRALPITEYPEIAPPTVVVNASFAGASAEVVAQTVAAPIEQEINGVDNLIYVVSQSTGNGAVAINVVFRPGTNIDQAQVLVQNRVAIALPRLPEEVRRVGVTVRKSSPDLLLVIHLISPDGSLDQQYISNYASINIKDVITRIDGVGDTIVFGARDYAMRVWLDPAQVQSRGLTASDVVAALRAANIQVAAGSINQPPAMSPGAFEIAVQTLGRLSSPEQFNDIVVATDEDGRVTRVRDIARVELGSQDYTSNAYLDDKVATAIGIFQRPGSNALATASAVLTTMKELSNGFPPGMSYRVAYDTTQFIQQSVDEVVMTILEAIVLVILVIILFLQSWRAAIIPIIAIPVSLVGTFFVMAAFGFSLNNLTLFGLVLAIGIVVDDAIVVVENVERYLQQGLAPRDAAYKTMEEVGGALVAIALVLCAVFIPTAFITGISGAFYRQFARDDRGVDDYFGHRVTHIVAGAGITPFAAAWPCSGRVMEQYKPAVQSVLRRIQSPVRQVVLGVCGRDAPPSSGVRTDACYLCRAYRHYVLRIRPHTIGLHTAPRSGLLHRCDFLAAGFESGAHRPGGAQSVRDPAVASGRCECCCLRWL